jgi:hypothetical protein
LVALVIPLNATLVAVAAVVAEVAVVALVAVIVPVPVGAKDAPLPTSIAAVVFVPPVSEENAGVALPAAAIVMEPAAFVMVMFAPCVSVAGTGLAPVEPIRTWPFVNAAVEVGVAPAPPPRTIPR